jgi:hypothetical protein
MHLTKYIPFFVSKITKNVIFIKIWEALCFPVNANLYSPEGRKGAKMTEIISWLMTGRRLLTEKPILQYLLRICIAQIQ